MRLLRGRGRVLSEFSFCFCFVFFSFSFSVSALACLVALGEGTKLKTNVVRLIHRFVPWYFKKDISKGFTELTAEGWKAVQEEIEEESSACIEHSLWTKLAAQ